MFFELSISVKLFLSTAFLQFSKTLLSVLFWNLVHYFLIINLITRKRAGPLQMWPGAEVEQDCWGSRNWGSRVSVDGGHNKCSGDTQTMYYNSITIVDWIFPYAKRMEHLGVPIFLLHVQEWWNIKVVVCCCMTC